MIDTFKLLTGCEDDTLSKYYLDKAKSTIKCYTKRNNTTLENYLSTYIIDLAVIYYNRRTVEGLQSHSTNGISETLLNDIPQDIKSALNSYRYFLQEEE